jgi:hypothetical protein
VKFGIVNADVGVNVCVCVRFACGLRRFNHGISVAYPLADHAPRSRWFPCEGSPGCEPAIARAMGERGWGRGGGYEMIENGVAEGAGADVQGRRTS